MTPIDHSSAKTILPPTGKKVSFEFFAFRTNSFWEKILDLQTLIGKFGLKYFPRFLRTLEK